MKLCHWIKEREVRVRVVDDVDREEYIDVFSVNFFSSPLSEGDKST